MSSLTAAGKLRKSRLEDPTQCNGFSSAARTRRIYTIIPVLGYTCKPLSDGRASPNCRFEFVIAEIWADIDPAR
jgi:hypothetical protein